MIKQRQKAGRAGQAALQKKLKAKHGKNWKDHYKKAGRKGGEAMKKLWRD